MAETFRKGLKGRTQHATSKTQRILEDAWEEKSVSDPVHVNFLDRSLIVTGGPLLLSLIMTKEIIVRRILRKTAASSWSVASARSDSVGLNPIRVNAGQQAADMRRRIESRTSPPMWRRLREWRHARSACGQARDPW